MNEEYKGTRALIDAALAQIAAESFLDDVLDSESAMRNRLENGPNHFNFFPNPIGDEKSATRSTELMQDDFFNEWTVLHQLPNTDSGFSVTVLRDSRGDITFSFRSTESLPRNLGGDFERDGGSGADGEILSHGFAFGQLLDMESYYEQLLQGSGPLLNDISEESLQEIRDYLSNPAKEIQVTGYSLGAHLAQVFTILHNEKVGKTTTFNGAGFGLLEGVESTVTAYQTVLNKAMEDFKRYLDDPDSLIRDFGVGKIAGVLKLNITSSEEEVKIALTELKKNGAVSSPDNIYQNGYYQLVRSVLSQGTDSALWVDVAEGGPFTDIETILQDVNGDRVQNYWGHGSKRDYEIVAGSGPMSST